jgi:hypothetical protein
MSSERSCNKFTIIINFFFNLTGLPLKKQFRVALAHATPDHAHAGEHHLHRVRDDVLRAAASKRSMPTIGMPLLPPS